MIRSEAILPKLADWRPPGNGRHSLHIPDEGSGWIAAVTADRNDVLGCLTWELTLRRTSAAAAADTCTLATWAKGAAARVTGLLEPLKVIEVDVHKNEALLRSARPTRRGDCLCYYEIHLLGLTEASLRRYQAPTPESNRRQQVLFPVTHEALAKVAADLVAARD